MGIENVKSVLSGINPGGCVQVHLEAFGAELIAGDYTVLTARDYVRSAAHLGRWMDESEVSLHQLTNEAVARFTQHECRCPGAGGYGRLPSRRTVARVRRFVRHLQDRGVVAVGSEARLRKIPAPLVGFREWMTHHHGATQRTIHQYENRIERMLPALGSDPACYDARLAREVLLEEVRDRHRTYAKTFVTALRAFLRFLAAKERCRPHLDRAVPAVREWRLSSLPRYLESEDVDRVIESCDRTRAKGVRDRAVLLLLARLGLRAGDIVALRIDDLDWKQGTVRVRGKGRKEVRLPLPQDAGEALAEYLKNARPNSTHACVFLCTNAPIRPFATSAVVSMIVRFAIERAGITDPPSKGAHLLRHSAATAMLRSGASLDAVATVLRHESSDMTAHYAKVDLALLELVAQPWPEGAPC